MNYQVLNKIRKKFVPWLILSLILVGGYLAFTIYIISGLNFTAKYRLYYIGYIFLAMGGQVGIVYVNVLINDFYYLKIFPHIKKTFLSSFFKEKFALTFATVTRDDYKLIRTTRLIHPRHRFKIIEKLVNKRYYLYEVSMLNDMRFRGFIYVAREKNNYPGPNLVLTNYRYYYRHKPKNYKQYALQTKQFKRQFKIFQAAPYLTDPGQLNTLAGLTSHLRHIGLSNINGLRMLLFSYKITDGQMLFLPPIFESLTPEYEVRLEHELKNTLKIAALPLTI